MRGRVREALVPELQALRDQNRSLRAEVERLQSIVQGKLVVRKVWVDEAGDIQWELVDIAKERNDE
jgi:hypothetical protein